MLTEEKTVRLLSEKKLKLAVAESCTGGLVAKRITDIPGASAVFDMGIICYSNEIKRRFLGVDAEILRTDGAVSEKTACAMAKGVCGAANADIGLATTGIAGPGGGTPEKPVGLVYIALYFKASGECFAERLTLSGSRAEIRGKTADRLFEALLERIG